MTSIANDACARFLDDLAAVVDGDDEVLARHLDHLAACDECRDARHDAAAAVEMIGAAGEDFFMPPDLEERVLGALGPAAPAPVAPSRQAVIDRPARRRRVRPAWLVAGGLSAAAVVAVIAVRGADDPLVAPSPGPAWTGSLAVIDRAAAGEGGVEVRTGDGFVPVRVGATVTARASIRTDDSTRVELAMRDGSRIYLDHGTELRVGEAGRVMTVARGNLVADVAHVERAPGALFHTAAGRVEVLGTRFSLTATDEQSSVRVVRGAVRLASARGVVEVRAGEEGVIARGAAPEVSAAGDVVGAIGWSSELLAPAEPAGEIPAGIGELRAFKPGEKRDRDWKLTLSRHKVTVRIAGNVARTEIEETFQNDSATALEGVYSFPLPPDARIERLALDVDGKMEEGAFVAKSRAAAIWRGVIRNATSRPVTRRDEIIWVPGPWRDPALLEWQQGGRFELRIFPIPRRGARTIQLAYTQILEPQGRERRYVYPLPHRSGTTPAAGAFDLDIRLSGSDPGTEPRVRNYAVDRRTDGDAIRLSMSATGFRPRGDLIVEYALPDSGAEMRAWSFAGAAAAAPSLAASRRGGADPAVVVAQHQIAADNRATALIALRPRLPRWTESRQRDYLLVIDSSQSMVGERFARARTLATSLIAEMDRRDRFALLACDVDCRSFADSVQAPSAKAARGAGEWLAEVEPAGASDLIASLTQASGLAEHGRETWILYIGDGAATTGYRRLADLRAEAAALSERARVSISTVGIGGDADTSSLAALARAGGGFFTPYVPGQRAELAALSVLETTFGVALERPVVALPAGLEDASPAELPTLRAGQELLIAARMSGPVTGDVVLRGTVGGKPYENRFPLALSPSESRGNAFVPRVWAALTIERMELDGEDPDRIVAMSQAYGVLSRHTSLLVLESPAMFRAFGVDRSRPQITWTGDEAAEGVESSGAVDFDPASNRFGGVLGNAQGDDGAAPAARPAATADLEDPHGGAKGKKAAEKAPSVPMDPRGRRWIPMRREWFRVGSIRTFDGVSTASLEAVSRALSALASQPDSRERHRALVQAFSFAGDLDRAFEMASKWLERDRLDPEALTTMADLLGRQGRRADAVRLLSGVVDLAPEDRALHARLAAAYDRIGATAKACSHRIALASLAPDDAALVSGALRCQRATGLADGADRLLRATGDKLRAAVETRAAQPETAERTTGELILDATWGGVADIDVSLVTPEGRRVSWLGGRGGLGVVGAGEAGRERLALRRIPAGNYLVELNRTDPTSSDPVSGAITLRAIDAVQTLPFSMVGDRVVLARITISRRSRLVPVDPMRIPR